MDTSVPSPFIYPIYGLAGIPEGFSRKCAVHGGTYMLNQSIDAFQMGPDNKFASIVQGENKKANAPIIIAHPKYFMKCGLESKLKSLGRVVRSICILDHPIQSTNDSTSLQLIIPQRQLNRHHDIFVCMVSNIHSVCKKGYYIAVVSTFVETSVPEHELKPAFELLEPIVEKFTTITEVYEPANLSK